MPLTGFTVIDSADAQYARQGDGRRDLRDDLHPDTVDNPESKQFVAGVSREIQRATGHFFRLRLRRRRGDRGGLEGDQRRHRQRTSWPRPWSRSNSTRRGGPFRFDPATHNPIQDIYICKVVESDGKAAGNQFIYTARTSPGPREEDILIAAVSRAAGGSVYGTDPCPAPQRAGLRGAAVFDGGRPVAHLRPDERRQPRARLVLHAGRVFRADASFRSRTASGWRWCWRRLLVA